MRTITLNDGTVYTVTMCGASGGLLWITIANYPLGMADAAVTFSDTERIKSIKHEAGENDHATYDGYTRLHSLQMDAEGGLTVALMKA